MGEHIPFEVKTRILRIYNEMTMTEKTIADFILSEGSLRIIEYNLIELAKQCNVSTASISRFCYKIGYGGLRDLKKGLARIKSEYITPLNIVDFNQLNSIDEAISFVIENMIHFLDETLLMIDKEGIKKAINLIEKSNYIKVFGVGGSSVTARHLQHYLQLYGKHTGMLMGFTVHEFLEENYNKDDVVISISNSGNTPIVCQATENAKAKGAHIISITSLGNNKLSELSDVHLQTAYDNRGSIDGFHVLERVMQLSIINMIIAGLFLRRKSNIKRKV